MAMPSNDLHQVEPLSESQIAQFKRDAPPPERAEGTPSVAAQCASLPR